MNRLSAAAFFVWGGLACLGGCGSGEGQSGSSANLSSSPEQLAAKVGGSFAAPQIQPRLQTSRFQVTSDWGSGYGANLEVANDAQPLSDWRLSFDFASEIETIWNARIVSHTGNHYVLAGESWNRDLAAGGRISVGWNGSPGNLQVQPTNLTLVSASGQPTPTPTPTASPTTTPSTTPTPTPTATPASWSASYSNMGDWGGGFQGEILVRNLSAQAGSWSIEFDLPANISSLWNGQVAERVGNHYRVTPASWSASLAPGAQASIGFIASPGGAQVSNLKVITEGAPPSPTPSPTPTASPTPPTAGNGNLKIVGYFPEWGIYDRNFQVAQIPASSLNVVNYAFADISAAGEVTLFDRWAAVDKPNANFAELRKLKQSNPGLLTMISVGGWTLSGRFSDVALTPASRQHFASSAVNFAVQYGFDGVDIDWEYPGGGGLEGNVVRAADKQNFTLLLQELRRQLDAQAARDRRSYYLSAALPAGADKIARLEPLAISASLDWMNLMTYDYHGGWENTTGHLAAISDARTTVEAYLAAGVPASKLLLGLPSYGRAWKNVLPPGMGRAANGLPQGTFEAGVFDYKDLVSKLRSSPAVWIRQWDEAAQAAWISAPSLQGGVVVSYEDAQSLQVKLQYLSSQGLAGAMIWDLSSDLAPTDPESLVGLARRFNR